MKVKWGRENAMKGLLVLLIFFLTMYAPMELSRVIVSWGLATEFIFELAFMWLFYGLAVFIISLIVQRRILLVQRHVKEKQGNKDRRNKMIKTVIRLQNDIVVVFDIDGEQISEYQGQYENVRASILRDAPPEAVFARWFNYDTDQEIVSREGW